MQNIIREPYTDFLQWITYIINQLSSHQSCLFCCGLCTIINLPQRLLPETKKGMSYFPAPRSTTG
ncbi:hypothetical protein F383_29252 [Gossypium arboreum]|uniref:Uncharacterized protein n=1 Tax=Gossypium arboreum TaxID=29729 RepID=A0A0B0PE84_GOSAR|nr:hypothetical protein F383_29252 [Gossypium arboreum]